MAALDSVAVDVYQYEALYKIVPTAAGPLYRGFRRAFEDLRCQASRII